MVGWEARLSTVEGSVVPLLPDQHLVDASRVHGERDQGELAWGYLRSDARSVGLVAMRVGVSGQNHKVDRRLGADELDDLVEVRAATSILATGGRSTDVKVELERDYTLAPVVGDPERLDARVVVRVTEHVRIFLVTADELDGRQYLAAHDVQELEDGAVLASHDDTSIDKCEGRRPLVTTNLVRPEGQLVPDVPHREGRILRDRRKRLTGNIVVEGNDRLETRVSEGNSSILIDHSQKEQRKSGPLGAARSVRWARPQRHARHLRCSGDRHWSQTRPRRDQAAEGATSRHEADPCRFEGRCRASIAH